jgi:hypothetical protein
MLFAEGLVPRPEFLAISRTELEQVADVSPAPVAADIVPGQRQPADGRAAGAPTRRWRPDLRRSAL